MTAPETPEKLPEKLLNRIKALLTKAESTEHPKEAEALTAKAAMLMAKYGIDRALLAATRPETDKSSSMYRDVDPPWADVTAGLLGNLATALRCRAVILERRVRPPGRRVHVFGFESDLGRLNVLFPSVVLQMSHALQVQFVPSSRAAAWRRSYLLGYSSAAVEKVMQAEAVATDEAGGSAELVLADRSLVIDDLMRSAYPDIRIRRVTYSGSGYRAGHVDGQRVDIGGTGVTKGATRSLR